MPKQANQLLLANKLVIKNSIDNMILKDGSIASFVILVGQGTYYVFLICKKEVKVVPYTFVSRGVPVRKDPYPEPSACEVGWPVPFLAAFISPVFPLGTYLLLGEQ